MTRVIFVCLVSAQNGAKSDDSSFSYFWNEWEIPKEDSVLKIQRDFHFALSDDEEVKRNGIFPFSAVKLRETPVFISSRFFVLNWKQGVVASFAICIYAEQFS